MEECFLSTCAFFENQKRDYIGAYDFAFRLTVHSVSDSQVHYKLELQKSVNGFRVTRTSNRVLDTDNLLVLYSEFDVKNWLLGKIVSFKLVNVNEKRWRRW
jgi:hypothetical protein